MEDIAAMLVSGLDFLLMEENMRRLTKSAFTNIPLPPAATAAPLSRAVRAGPSDTADRISHLPATILGNIVSRLPAKDAARTTVLSTRWRRVWHTTPLVLLDAHLLPKGARPRSQLRSLSTDPRLRDLLGTPGGLTDVVSTVLAAHPGPFRCVYLVGTPMKTHGDELALWLQHLAAKAAQELIFLNRATTLGNDVHLPATIFRCISLVKLYLGFWRFPDTATVPRTVAFPYLRELALFSVIMKERDLAFVLDRCPVLEKLLLIGSRWQVCLRVDSPSLRLVEVCEGIVPEITVAHASRLERLLLWEVWGDGPLANLSTKIKIGHAPKLRFLGFLVPGMHKLEIGNTVIQAQTKASPNTTVPSVQMLAVQLKLGVRTDARMLPSFLRCFPNVETLYIQSENDNFSLKLGGIQSTGIGKLNSHKFWKEVGPIECVLQRIKKVVLREFRGTRGELDFLKFIAEHARVLEKMLIVMSQGHSPSDAVATNLKTKMASAKWVNASCELIISQTPFPQHEGTAWCYLSAFNLSNPDPFDVSKCPDGKCQGH